MKRISLIAVCSLLFCACTDFGKQVSKEHIEVYYKDGITPTEAQHTADVLYWIDKENNGGSAKKSFQATRRGDTVLLRMVADAKKAAGLTNDAFESIGLIIADSVFNGKPVAIELTDDHFKNGKYIAFNPGLSDLLNAGTDRSDVALSEFGERYQAGNVEVFYQPGVTAAEAQQVQAYLLKEMQPENLISFQLQKDAQGQLVLNMASTKEQAANFDKKLLQEMTREISVNLLGGDKVTFSITDQSFHPVQTAMYPQP